jgi:hypothetical protein
MDRQAELFVKMCRLDNEYPRVMAKFEVVAERATALIYSSVDMLPGDERSRFLEHRVRSEDMGRRIAELERASSETKQTIIQLFEGHPDITRHLEEVGLWPI